MLRPTLCLALLGGALGCWPRNDLSDSYGGGAAAGAAGSAGAAGAPGSGGSGGSGGAAGTAGESGASGGGGAPPVEPRDAGAGADASPDASDAAP